MPLNALNTTEEIRRSRPRMAILPVGATEQHGPHLPLATDSIIVEAVARGVADRLRAYCLPGLPFSISHMHRGSAGTVWLRNATLAAVLRDIAVSLRSDGFRQFVILNGHGGNAILVPVVQDLNMEFPDLLTIALDAWDGIHQSRIFHDLGETLHADEFETSVMLYLQPESVRRDQLRDQRREPDRDLLRYRPFRALAKHTFCGHPTRASARQGQQAVEYLTERVTRRIRTTLRKAPLSFVDRRGGATGCG